jgi:hypothetical protein
VSVRRLLPILDRRMIADMLRGLADRVENDDYSDVTFTPSWDHDLEQNVRTYVYELELKLWPGFT